MRGASPARGRQHRAAPQRGAVPDADRRQSRAARRPRHDAAAQDRRADAGRRRRVYVRGPGQVPLPLSGRIEEVLSLSAPGDGAADHAGADLGRAGRDRLGAVESLVLAMKAFWPGSAAGLNLPRFCRHLRSHESAVGVCHGQTEAAGVHEEFKAEAVRLVRESGKSVPTVARELDLTETALRSWVRQAEIDAGRGTPGALTTEEREELGRPRSRHRTLRMQRDILKKATAFFAKENP